MADVDYALKFGAMQLQNQIAHDKGMSGKKGKGKGKNKGKQQSINSEKTGDFQIDTTLHGYPMIGPFTPGQKDVWYCDNAKCQYTQHGVYRRYKIQNWRSSQFGKKFVLCDGCVRQYQKVQPVQTVQPASSNVNVKVNMNIPPQPGAPRMLFWLFCNFLSSHNIYIYISHILRIQYVQSTTTTTTAIYKLWNATTNVSTKWNPTTGI